MGDPVRRFLGLGVSANELPFVSIIVACRDEDAFIDRCLESIITSTYPTGKYEVLVVDGMSTDGSRRVVERYTLRHPSVRLLDNPKGIAAAAFNLGARAAQGDVILIMGAHATYGPDYIERCVKALLQSGADNVGGVLKTVPRTETILGRSIALALSHPFGVGDAVFRTGAKQPMWVDTVFGGCYRRSAIERVGYWNEDLTYSQDLEFNRRLVASGGRILLVPDIVVAYYARTDLGAFIRHTVRNGVWSVLPFREASIMPVRWRHLVPGVFVSLLLALAGLSFGVPLARWGLLALAGAYVGAALAVGVVVAWRQRDVRYVVTMMIAFATLHLAYGLGSLWGLARLLRE